LLAGFRGLRPIYRKFFKTGHVALYWFG